MRRVAASVRRSELVTGAVLLVIIVTMVALAEEENSAA